MSLTDKQKAAIIRDVFLTDEHFSSNNEDELKYFHKDSAVGVRIRKSQLKQDEVLLNKFSEYLTLTKFD